MSDALTIPTHTSYRARLRFGPQVAARVPADWIDQPYTRFELRPKSPTIGAEVVGVDLTDLDDATFADIHRALLEWKVLFFRNCGLDPEAHAALGRRWGELEFHPFLTNRVDQPVTVRFEKNDAVAGFENIWHSDVSWRALPSLGSLLRAVEVPSAGGDTLWADMGAAYDCLPDDVKARIDGLEAVHDWIDTFGAFMSDDERQATRADFPASVHPVVRTHPETGRKGLFVNGNYVRHFEGWTEAESAPLLQYLYAQASRPEYTWRHHWQVGDLLIWDNRCTQHAVVGDVAGQERALHRVTIEGDIPV